MRGLVLLGLLGVLIVYLVLGGLVFWWLESDNEIQQQQQHQQQQQELNQTAVPIDERLIIGLIDALNGKSFECLFYDFIFKRLHRKINTLVYLRK